MKFSLLLVALCAFLLSCKTGEPSGHIIEKRWFEHVDGIFTKAEYIDLSPDGTDRLDIRYGPISDSGVELE
jgi:hypothetical protein